MAQGFSDTDAGVALRRVLRVAAEMRLGRIFRRRWRGRMDRGWRWRQMTFVGLILLVLNKTPVLVGRPAVEMGHGGIGMLPSISFLYLQVDKIISQ